MSGFDNAVNSGGGGGIEPATISENGTITIPTTQKLSIGDGSDGSYGWQAGVGPRFTSDESGRTLILDVSSFTNNRTQAAPNVSGTLAVITATSTTVGASGAASALPANPLGYFVVTRQDGVSVKVAYHNL